jgi:hypothetical protein
VTDYGDPDLETITPPSPPAYPAPLPASLPEVQLEPNGRGALFGLVAALVIVSLVVGFGTATFVLNARDSSPKQAVVTLPDDTVLGGLIVQQRDVPAGYTVSLLLHGAELTVATLDLCNGRFSSEAQRVARRQVALLDRAQLVHMSTEAILYRAPSVGAQAFRELRSVAAHCPPTPVKSPVGEPTVTTRFRPAPDGTWPRTPTVERLAYDFVTTDATTGGTSHSMAIYLRRGKALIGLYFAQPDDPQIAVAGRTTVAGIVGLFEARLAKVPAELIGG